jgi:hypothetical protein
MSVPTHNPTAKLIGKVLWTCQRAAEMATFQFGQRTKRLGLNGKEKEVGELALHIQCPWRITSGNEIFVGSRDVYYPVDSDGRQASDDFDWDRSPNRRGELLNRLFNGNRLFIVHSTELGPGGSLRIEFENGFLLEAFPDNSLSLEHWRFFSPGDDRSHFIVAGPHPTNAR